MDIPDIKPVMPPFLEEIARQGIVVGFVAVAIAILWGLVVWLMIARGHANRGSLLYPVLVALLGLTLALALVLTLSLPAN